jgi:spermidine synthase
VYDDARHFVLTTDEKFDIITSDPIHPWVKGAATLYTTEYFEMVKKHLNPGGVISQWVPLYDSVEDVVKSEFATFFHSFPNGTVWSNDIDGAGYDVMLVGQNGSSSIDLDRLSARLDHSDHAAVVESLREVGFSPALSLFATYAGQGPDLQQWLQNAELNADRNLRLQYLAGLGVNSNNPDGIYQEFLAYRKFPDNLFTGSDAMKENLKAALFRSGEER